MFALLTWNAITREGRLYRERSALVVVDVETERVDVCGWYQPLKTVAGQDGLIQGMK